MKNTKTIVKKTTKWITRKDIKKVMQNKKVYTLIQELKYL